MPYSVALLTSSEHGAYIESVTKSLDLPFQLTIKPYTSVRDLPALFDEVVDQFDAFCTTGTFSRLLLKRTHPDCDKPIVAFLESAADLYRLLLTLLYGDPNCDFSRIYFDFSLWFKGDQLHTALDYVEGRLEFGSRLYTKMLGTITMDQLFDAEDIISNRAVELWEAGELDLLICRHSTAYLAARARGVPCTYAYASPSNIEQNLQRVEHELDHIQLEENMPAVISLTSPVLLETGADEITGASIDIQRGLLDFNQEKAAGMTIKRVSNAFELYTTRRVVQRITKHGTQDILGEYLFGRLGQQVSVGYGVGINLTQATYHARAAMDLALKEGGSRIIDEEGSLWEQMNPPKPETRSAVDERVNQVAEQSGLSPLTIQRISTALDMMGTKEVTTQELADTLQVTSANANRFIKQLHIAGIAVQVGEKRVRQRGRPTKIYRIAL